MVLPKPVKLFQPTELTDYMRFYRVPARAWWWGFIAVAAIVVAFLVSSFGAAFAIIIVEPNWIFDQSVTTPAVFLINNVSIVAMVPLAVLVSYLIYHQGFGWLTSVVGRFRWKWFWIALGVFAAGYAVETAAEIAILGPSDYGLFDLSILPTTALMIVGILLTTPLQCAGEEYAVRGVLARSLAGLIPHRLTSLIVAAVGSSLVFMWIHGAGDPWLNVFYFGVGLIMWWLAYRTGGLEASIALHIVNNLFSEWMLPFSDISGMFDRSEGTGSPIMLAYLAVEVVLILIVDFIARQRGVVRSSAPAAARPVVVKPTKFVSTIAELHAVNDAVDLPRYESTPRQILYPTPSGGYTVDLTPWLAAPPLQSVPTSDAPNSLLHDADEGRSHTQLGDPDPNQSAD
jgi:membrane protease YdiL (CAAX protease family)